MGELTFEDQLIDSFCEIKSGRTELVSRNRLRQIEEWELIPLIADSLKSTASKRRGNNLKGPQDFVVKAKAIIWLWLS